ncbi:hypothetical protein OPQ81_005373 [Rhizoctonia solani]|nr:hypothetical protein OPQ81_005373 [Rhizoctonia solani]
MLFGVQGSGVVARWQVARVPRDNPRRLFFVWKIDPRTGSASLFQQNRCTSYVAGMTWLGNNLITFGLRHMKAWKVVDGTQRPASPSKKYPAPDPARQSPSKTLPGRNAVLGSLLEASFTCAVALMSTAGQMKLTLVTTIDFHITSCALRSSMDRPFVLAGGNDDSDRHIDLWNADTLPEAALESARVRLAGQNVLRAGHSTSEEGRGSQSCLLHLVRIGQSTSWDMNGSIKENLDICVGQAHTGDDMESRNQLCVVRADEHGHVIAAGDRVGNLLIIERADGHLLLRTKAHMSEITHLAVRHDSSRSLIATSGRDRTVQLFHRTPGGSFNLLQTLAFPSKSRPYDPDFG